MPRREKAAGISCGDGSLIDKPAGIPPSSFAGCVADKGRIRTAPQTPHRAIDRVVTELRFESNIELLIEHQRQHLTWSISKFRDYV